MLHSAEELELLLESDKQLIKNMSEASLVQEALDLIAKHRRLAERIAMRRLLLHLSGCLDRHAVENVLEGIRLDLVKEQLEEDTGFRVAKL